LICCLQLTKRNKNNTPLTKFFIPLFFSIDSFIQTQEEKHQAYYKG
jgi:hypothetical protein